MLNIFEIGLTPTTTAKMQEKHRFLILMSMVMGMGSLVWGGISLFYGLIALSSIPFGYALLTLLNLSVFSITKEFKTARFVQVFLSILLPFVFQWLMGGFTASGAIGLWALVPLSASLTFHRINACWKWLAFYIILVLISGWQDTYFDAHAFTHTDDKVHTFFFTINISIISASAFGLTLFFKAKNDQAGLALQSSYEELQMQEEEVRQNLEEISAINDKLEKTKDRLQMSFDLERQVRTDLEEKEMKLYNALKDVQKKEAELQQKAAELEKKSDELEGMNINLQNQNMLVRAQNDVIELWNKKITQNINYARRIQTALMANEEQIRGCFPDSFVIERPKDIVGGDFYWMSIVDSSVVLVIADCTGHGVSGALMSIIGASILNEIVISYGLADPQAILENLDSKLASVINQSANDTEAKVNDGMDAIVLSINLDDYSLDFAAAHTPLYLIRNGELQEFKGSRFPLGGSQRKKARNYEAHTIKLEPNDCIYAGSDGFKDQFGGTEGRSLMAKRLRQWLQDAHSHPMNIQGKLLLESWEKWMEGQKQTDDVLMVGIKFSGANLKKMREAAKTQNISP